MAGGRSSRSKSDGLPGCEPATGRGAVEVSDKISELLATYPRLRPPMTPVHEALYASEYKRNRTGAKGLSKLVARLEGWMHRTVAKGARRGRVLELGAGTLNHLPYEPEHEIYDIVEPFRPLWQDSPHLLRVTAVYDDILEIPGNKRYDRILSIAVLEHVTDLPTIVSRSAMLLADGGRFQAGIPTEGGLLWGIAWRSTTAIAYRLRTGLNYGVLMRHEHINSADDIITVTRFFFSEVRVRRFPLSHKHTSFYTVLEATRPRQQRCRLHDGALRGRRSERD